jgi:hypothetical protein
MSSDGDTKSQQPINALAGELSTYIGEVAQPLSTFVDAPPVLPRHQDVVTAKMGGRTGVGVLEEIHLGPDEPTGLTGFLDGYGART